MWHGTVPRMAQNFTSVLRIILQIANGLFFAAVFLLLILAGLTATTKDRTVLIGLALLVVFLPLIAYGMHLLIGWLLKSRLKAPQKLEE